MTPVVLLVGSQTADQRHAVVAAGGWPVLIATAEDGLRRWRQAALPEISLVVASARAAPEQIARLHRVLQCPVLLLPPEQELPHAIAWAL